MVRQPELLQLVPQQWVKKSHGVARLGVQIVRRERFRDPLHLEEESQRSSRMKGGAKLPMRPINCKPLCVTLVYMTDH